MFAASVVALAGLIRPGAAAKPPAICGRFAAAIQLCGFSRNYLISRLAYRIQELAYGGLKPATPGEAGRAGRCARSHANFLRPRC